MSTLADCAQITMDLYYRDFQTDEDFFSLDQFMYLCGVAYSKLLEDEYKEARREAKAEEGIAEVLIQSDWLVKSVLEAKPSDDYHNTFEIDLPKPVFSFPYDIYGYGIQSLRAVGAPSCRNFIRSSERESWMQCMMPVTTRGFFYLVGQKIIIRNSRCDLKKVEVLQVPEITDLLAFGATGGPVPSSKQDTIIRKTLDLLMRTREGAVVDMTNNSNPNKALQTELDTTFKNLKTNP